jgi:hypothetical protein
MKRLVPLAMACAAVALMVPGAASAATGDVQRLEVDDPVVIFDDGDKLAVEGGVECRVDDNWGIIMKAFQDVVIPGVPIPLPVEGNADFEEFGPDTSNFDNEALGFGGPGSGNQGPVEQPCSETGTDFDLVLEKLGGSGDFLEGDAGLFALAAESPTQQADPAFLGDAEVFYGNVTLEQED